MNIITRSWVKLLGIVLLLATGRGSALAQGDLNVLFTPSAGDGSTPVFTAGKIITMDPANPTATAVAVAGDRIVAVGSLDDVRNALAERPFGLDDRFAGKALMPGLIEQHLHPILAVPSPCRWRSLRSRTGSFPDGHPRRRHAARIPRPTPRGQKRRSAIPKAYLFTWGYHQLWHGPMSRAALDAVSATRPIVVWHRSAHELYLNSAAIVEMGITEASLERQGPGQPPGRLAERALL